MKKTTAFAVVALLALVLAACGGKSAEEQLVEELIENSGEGISDIDINTDDGDFNMTIEGEDGESINVTGSGDDSDFNMTIEGEDGQDVNISSSGDTVTMEGEDGETMTFGGGEIPDNLDLPVPDGGTVTMSLSSGTDATVMLQYPLSDFDGLVAFYDAQLDASSDSVDRNETTMSTEDRDFRTVNWSDTDYTWNVTVSDCFVAVTDEADAACVTLYRSE